MVIRYSIWINSLPLDLFKSLVEITGFDINTQDVMHYTPVYYVICSREPKNNISVSILLHLRSQDGFDVNVKDHDGGSITHWVCCNINTLPIDVVMCLIETKRVVEINGLDDARNAPIYIAIEQFSSVYGGDVNIKTRLLRQDNLTIDLRDKNDFTTLYWVCWKIHFVPVDTYLHL